ncbi:MAG: hypothetical protein IJL88_03225 [Clostridia bacterium]|nr:hypothetical protein [Clostridia bacterium]
MEALDEMFIGMDVGGTTARVRVVNAENAVCWEGEDRGGTLAGIGREELSERLGCIIRCALTASGCTADDCERLCIGASGVDTEEARLVYEDILVSLGFAREKLMVINDAELLIRMFETPAVVLIAGTGSIALGCSGKDGIIRRCGGWEHLLSDEGSATWLGMELLRTYVRVCDGRGQDPVLRQLLEEAVQVHNAQDAVDFCARHILEKADLAALAPLTEKGAGLGSASCLSILEKGADELTDLVRQLVPSVSADGDFRLLLWGSVLLKNRIIQRMVAERVKKVWPAADVCVPQCTALDCAVLLAQGKKQMPLREIC